MNLTKLVSPKWKVAPKPHVTNSAALDATEDREAPEVFGVALAPPDAEDPVVHKAQQVNLEPRATKAILVMPAPLVRRGIKATKVIRATKATRATQAHQVLSQLQAPTASNG